MNTTGIFRDLPLNDYLASVLINNRVFHLDNDSTDDDGDDDCTATTCDGNANNEKNKDNNDDDDGINNDNVDTNDVVTSTSDNNNGEIVERDGIVVDDNNNDDNDRPDVAAVAVDNGNSEISQSSQIDCCLDYDIERFVRITKKMRQQILSRLLSRLRNQLVVYNVKALFRAYMIYHRDDRLIYAICDVFSKRRVYDVNVLRREMIAKNTKPFQRKVLRNKFCNQVMTSQPHILRLFDTRALTYCRTKLLLGANALHDISNCLPVIMCLKVEDIDTIFERCRQAHSRRTDFPIDLLPSCVRSQFARLLGMRGF